MNKRDEYLWNAEECQRMADLSRNHSDKSRWLQLAEKWLRLVPVTAFQKAPDSFDRMRQQSGTGRKESASAH
jgi:hypothetical protein